MSFDFSDAEMKDAKFIESLSNLSPAMEKSQKIIEDSVSRRFAEEGDGQSSWKPLAQSTLADRKRKGFALGPILQRTGEMKNSVTGAHDETSAEVGPTADYAKYHLGQGRVHREFLALTEPEVDSIEQAIIEHLERSGG